VSLLKFFFCCFLTTLFSAISCVMRYKYKYVELHIQGCVLIFEEPTHSQTLWWISPVATGGSAGVEGGEDG
jgi:hypothetical protein